MIYNLKDFQRLIKTEKITDNHLTADYDLDKEKIVKWIKIQIGNPAANNRVLEKS